MSKKQDAILDYIKGLDIGTKVSIRMLAEHLNIRTPQCVKLDCKQNFDEETINANEDLFLSSLIPSDIKEKYYLSDIGLRTYLLGNSLGKDLGHIFENVIF